VGPEESFDKIGATQFLALVEAGLREKDRLLDVGCGCLRGGRFSIMYLNKGNYFGVEPREDIVRAGIREEIGQDLVDMKNPTFKYNEDFDFSGFPQFNYVLVHSIFIHAGLEQIKACLEKVKSKMEMGGKILFTFKPGSHDNREAGWTYPNPVVYTSETIEALLKEFNLSFEPMDIDHPHQWVMSQKLDN